MRILGHIPYKNIRIIVFGMNDKYVIRFEAGLMEQVFKINQNEISGMDGISELLDEAFMEKIIHRFNEMFTEFDKAKNRFNEKSHT